MIMIERNSIPRFSDGPWHFRAYNAEAQFQIAVGILFGILDSGRRTVEVGQHLNPISYFPTE